MVTTKRAKKKTVKRFKSSVPQTPFNRALKYLSYRTRSFKEVYDYLVKKAYSDEEIRTTLKQLQDLHFLNDNEFANSFAKSRQARGKSKRTIIYELKLKGIDKESSEQIVNELKDDLQNAAEYIKKYSKQLERYDPSTREKKIINRLRLRGYNWDIISKVIKRVED